jgi:hypothetical protein
MASTTGTKGHPKALHTAAREIAGHGGSREGMRDEERIAKDTAGDQQHVSAEEVRR